MSQHTRVESVWVVYHELMWSIDVETGEAVPLMESPMFLKCVRSPAEACTQSWTPDHQEAMRFKRKADAEACIFHWFNSLERDRVSAVEVEVPYGET